MRFDETYETLCHLSDCLASSGSHRYIKKRGAIRNYTAPGSLCQVGAESLCVLVPGFYVSLGS